MSERFSVIDNIRCLVTIALVLYHSLAPYTGAWGVPNGIHSEPVLYWGVVCLLLFS